MNFRKPSSRWALWVFAAALLLKSVMPWLASASAELQGKTLIEVCTLYGVSLVPLGAGGDHEPGSGHAPDHGSEHCALTALAALADTPPPALAAAASPLREALPRCMPLSSLAADACATWVARLKHGPPSFA